MSNFHTHRPFKGTGDRFGPDASCNGKKNEGFDLRKQIEDLRREYKTNSVTMCCSLGRGLNVDNQPTYTKNGKKHSQRALKIKS